tara:strand:+ start:641 stop:1312 length:672 start_codon:yes stop_codon:yes gene_type:complete
VKRIDCPQYSPEWWTARLGVPTASNFAKIITPAKGDRSTSDDGYIAELIADHFDPYYGCPEDYITDAMRRGTEMEPEARNFYAFERGLDVEQVGFCLTDDGHFGASPDGMPGEGALELKCPLRKTQVEYLLGGVLPTKYKPQCHGHLVVTGAPWCDFMAYCPGMPPLLKRVEPDDYTEKLRDALAAFWIKYRSAVARIEELRGEPLPRPTPPAMVERDTSHVF